MTEEQRKTGEASVTEQTSMSEDGYGYSGNPFEELEQDLCKRCKRRHIDRSENPQSVLCRECREELIQLKIPVSIIVFCIIVVLLILVSIGKFSLDFAKFKSSDSAASFYHDINQEREASNETDYEKADRTSDASKEEKNFSTGEEEYIDIEDMQCNLYRNMADMGEVITAMDSMVEIIENDPDYLNMALTLADVAMTYSYPDYAAWVIENYLMEETLLDEDMEKINGYIDELNVYYETYDIVETIYNEEYENIGDTEEDYIAAMQSCHDRIAEYIGNDAYDQAFLEYNISFFCMDTEEWISHLENCIAEETYYFDAHAQLANYYRRSGELDKAREILRPIYWKNKEDYSLLRAYATLEMAEGNLELALTYAEKAYEIYSEGEYVTDTYIIALTANGQTEEAEALIKEWEEAGYFFDDDFYAFQRGEMTLEEYYIGE